MARIADAFPLHLLVWHNRHQALDSELRKGQVRGAPSPARDVCFFCPVAQSSLPSLSAGAEGRRERGRDGESPELLLSHFILSLSGEGAMNEACALALILRWLLLI